MMRLQHDLGVAQEFWRLANTFSSIEGFLDPREGYALYRLAADGPGLGAIVEIGSYCGLSTAYLAAGSKAAHREKVIAVDHFLGSPEHQAGGEWASAVLTRQGTTFYRFCENLARLHLLQHVQAIQATSAEAALAWKGPVRLLFIDAEHSYESVRTDFDNWQPFVVAGGLIALHDVGNAAGVTRLFEEAISAEGGFQLVSAVVSLRVLQKR